MIAISPSDDPKLAYTAANLHVMDFISTKNPNYEYQLALWYYIQSQFGTKEVRNNLEDLRYGYGINGTIIKTVKSYRK